jgi:hypothetical protein
VLFINKKSSVYSPRETFTGISSGERDKLLLTPDLSQRPAGIGGG